MECMLIVSSHVVTPSGLYIFLPARIRLSGVRVSGLIGALLFIIGVLRLGALPD